MRIYNLTDMETPGLKKKGLVGQTIVVGPRLLHPGDAADVPDEYAAPLRAGLQQLVSDGALAIGSQPPASYVLAKARKG